MVTVKNYLWDESTGLPESFDEDEIDENADQVFAHLLVTARGASTPSGLV